MTDCMPNAATDTAVQPSAGSGSAFPDLFSDVETSGSDGERAAPVITPEILASLQRQVEFYLSDANLPTDKKLLKTVRKDPEGYVPVKLFVNFRKIRSMTKEPDVVVAALRTSKDLQLSPDETMIRRIVPVPDFDIAGIQKRTIVVENLLPALTIEDVTEMFLPFGAIKVVRICAKDGKSKLPGWLTTVHPPPSLPHAYIEYDDEEAAVKAAVFGNDSRHELRVSRLTSLLQHLHGSGMSSSSMCSGSAPHSRRGSSKGSSLRPSRDPSPAGMHQGAARRGLGGAGAASLARSFPSSRPSPTTSRAPSIASSTTSLEQHMFGPTGSRRYSNGSSSGSGSNGGASAAHSSSGGSAGGGSESGSWGHIPTPSERHNPAPRRSIGSDCGDGPWAAVCPAPSQPLPPSSGPGSAALQAMPTLADGIITTQGLEEARAAAGGDVSFAPPRAGVYVPPARRSTDGRSGGGTSTGGSVSPVLHHSTPAPDLAAAAAEAVVGRQRGPRPLPLLDTSLDSPVLAPSSPKRAPPPAPLRMQLSDDVPVAAVAAAAAAAPPLSPRAHAHSRGQGDDASKPPLAQKPPLPSPPKPAAPTPASPRAAKLNAALHPPVALAAASAPQPQLLSSALSAMLADVIAAAEEHKHRSEPAPAPAAAVAEERKQHGSGDGSSIAAAAAAAMDPKLRGANAAAFAAAAAAAAARTTLASRPHPTSPRPGAVAHSTIAIPDQPSAARAAAAPKFLLEAPAAEAAGGPKRQPRTQAPQQAPKSLVPVRLQEGKGAGRPRASAEAGGGAAEARSQQVTSLISGILASIGPLSAAVANSNAAVMPAALRAPQVRRKADVPAPAEAGMKLESQPQLDLPAVTPPPAAAVEDLKVHVEAAGAAAAAPAVVMEVATAAVVVAIRSGPAAAAHGAGLCSKPPLPASWEHKGMTAHAPKHCTWDGGVVHSMHVSGGCGGEVEHQGMGMGEVEEVRLQRQAMSEGGWSPRKEAGARSSSEDEGIEQEGALAEGGEGEVRKRRRRRGSRSRGGGGRARGSSSEAGSMGGDAPGGDASLGGGEDSGDGHVGGGFEAEQQLGAAAGKKLSKRDYAAWAAATPEYRAEASARFGGAVRSPALSPSRPARVSGSGDDNWRVASKEQQRSPGAPPAPASPPHAPSGPAAPGKPIPTGPLDAHVSAMLNSRGPDGSRGFALGRGRALQPPQRA